MIDKVFFNQLDYKTHLSQWFSGLDSEIRFWNDFIQNNGGEWPDDYIRRTEKSPLFTFRDRKFDSWPPHVLDVGAGPISLMGDYTEKGKINIQACDPLAYIYEVILANNHINPYLKTDFALVELLNLFYEENSFDLVTMRNALDHAWNPILGLAQMIDVCKYNSFVIIQSMENEAEFERYQGLHQWNLSHKDNELIIYNRSNYFNISQLFNDYVEIDLHISYNDNIKRNHLTAYIKKSNDIKLITTQMIKEYYSLTFPFLAYLFSSKFKHLYNLQENILSWPDDLLEILKDQECKKEEIMKKQECQEIINGQESKKTHLLYLLRHLKALFRKDI